MRARGFRRHLIYGFMGLIMGFILSRIGFGDFQQVHEMFTLQNIRMLFTFAVALTLSMVVFGVLFDVLPVQRKPFHPGIVPGSVLFGFGWAICGACPSIVFVQLGEGQLSALPTLGGMMIGVVSYRFVHRRFFSWDQGVCSA